MYATGKILLSSTGFTAGTLPDKKYYDTYLLGSDANDFSKSNMGDAMKEIIKTKNSLNGGWYSDYSYIPYLETTSWFSRGGGPQATNSGPFNFDHTSGGPVTGPGSRAVLVAN